MSKPQEAAPSSVDTVIKKQARTFVQKKHVPEPQDSRAVKLLRSYLSKNGSSESAVFVPDRRPADQIYTDLRALPLPELVELRNYILEHPYFSEKALEVMGMIFPSRHKEFLFEAMKKERMFAPAVRQLAAMDDATVVEPILDRADVTSVGALVPLVRPSNPAFLEAVRKRNADGRMCATAFVLGCYGHLAEADLRLCAASLDLNVRSSTLYGLSLSPDKDALALLLDIADVSNDSDNDHLAHRFVSEGEKHVPTLIAWLGGPPGKEAVAAYALSHIPSEVGVRAVLHHFEDKPFEGALAGDSAHASPKAAREFIADRAVHGTRQQRLNALALAHQLGSYDRPEPGKEHPIFAVLLKASHDADEEVRYQSLNVINEYAFDAHYPEGIKALRRIVEMMRDPAPRVRGEAAMHASEYPCPEVLELLKKMADDGKEDPHVREIVKRAAESLAERLSHLSGTGQTAVSLKGGGSSR